MPSAEGGLGGALVGEKLMINHRQVHVTKLLGEGGFSYVYLVKEISDTSQGQSLNNTVHGGEIKDDSSKKQAHRMSETQAPERKEMVLKVTSIVSRQQREIAEKEAKLLSRLSHPSIVKMYDTCYRTIPAKSGSRGKHDDAANKKERPQHLILMEFCEGGHSLEICNNMLAAGKRFDLSTLIIAFGQICNAVSYLHAQRPPIVHRDLKPANFLVKGGAYKLCDFGSAVFGHVDLKTPQARAEAEEVVQKTTTQMFRAPEMVDLFSAKKLTQATDVWALGCCLYSMAFLQNCFEEGSNLAILSRKYKIPDDNPYGDGLVELIDRMLTVDVKARADMTEVILCLSAVYSGRPLPPRKEPKPKKEKEKEKEQKKEKIDDTKSPKTPRKKKERPPGALKEGVTADGLETEQPVRRDSIKEGKKLNPNSVAARRKKSAVSSTSDFAPFDSKFEDGGKGEADPFASGADAFAAFGDDNGDGTVFNAFAEGAAGHGAPTFEGGWDEAGADGFASFSPETGGTTHRERTSGTPGRTRSSSSRRPRRKEEKGDAKEEEEDDEIDVEEVDESGVSKTVRKTGPRRGLRRQNSYGDGLRRSRSKGPSKKEERKRDDDDDDDDDDESD